MSNFNVARETIERALRSNRIGTPVSVRLVIHTTADHGEVDGVLDEVLDAACGWLGGSPEKVRATGGDETGQTSVLIQWAGGRTALVSVGTHGEAAPLLEIVLVGNRGVLAWEADGRETPLSEQRGPAPRTEGSEALVRAVRMAIKTGGPVEVVSASGRSRADQASEAKRSTSKKSTAAGAAGPRVTPPQPQKPPYGVLLNAGLHTHQENYAQSLAEDPRCKLIGLTDEAGVSERRAKLNARLAESLGIPLLPDLDDALARDDVHLVSICAEPERRGSIMVRCAEAGKHLYLDKPLCTTVADSDAIVEAVRRAGVRSQMFSQVHGAASQRARALVESGALGDLVAVHCDLFFAKGAAGHADLSRPRKEAIHPEHFEWVESKRELANVGVYPLVFLRWLLGREIRNVYAVTSNYFFAEHQKNDMEDFGVALLELSGGVTATLCVGRAGWRCHPMSGVNKTYLIGTKACACVDASRPRLEVWADEPPWTAPPRHPEDPMGFWSSTQAEVNAQKKQAWIIPQYADYDDARYFLDCIEQGRESDVPAEAGAQATEVLLAAYRSAATGEVVSLPLARD